MKSFFDTVRPMFGGVLSQSQVNGLETLLAATRDLPLPWRAYVLATAKHETGDTMLPVREAFAHSSDEAVRRLDRAWRDGKLKRVRTPYWRPDRNGQSWHGRGYVQLTHKGNYSKAGREIGVDLLSNPDAAMNPEIAAKIIVQGMSDGWFTDERMSDYLTGTPDYVNARRIVNGTDRAELIAQYARTFEKALRTLPATIPAQTPASPLAAFLRAALRIIIKAFTGRRT